MGYLILPMWHQERPRILLNFDSLPGGCFVKLRTIQPLFDLVDLRACRSHEYDNALGMCLDAFIHQPAAASVAGSMLHAITELFPRAFMETRSAQLQVRCSLRFESSFYITVTQT